MRDFFNSLLDNYSLNLTEEGQAIYEQAQYIQNSIVKIQRLAQNTGVDASGTVRLSLPEGLGQEVIITALDDFYQQYPNVKLVFNVSATTANLEHREAGVTVRLFRPEEPELTIKFLGEMTLGLYA